MGTARAEKQAVDAIVAEIGEWATIRRMIAAVHWTDN